MKHLLSLLTLSACLGIAVTAHAHTSLTAAIPKGGSELTESPPVIELQFHEAAKLTSVTATGEDKQERRLDFIAGDKPNTFKVRNPALVAGRNEVKWKALSNDGHVITGTLIYVVKLAKSH